MNKSHTYILFSIIFWATSPVVIRLLLSGVDNFQVSFYTSLFSAATLFLIVVFQKKLSILKKYSKKDILKICLLGFFGIFLYNLLFVYSFVFLTTQEDFVLNYLWPVLVVIFGIIILKEKVSMKKILAIVLGFIGVSIVVSKGAELSFLNPFGVVLAVSGAVSYSLFSVLSKRCKYEKFTSMFLYCLFSVPFSFLVAISLSQIIIPTLEQLIGLLWLGSVTIGLGFTFWLKAIEVGDTAKMSNLVLATPFLSLVFVYLILGEEIIISSIIGLVLIISGILVQSRRK